MARMGTDRSFVFGAHSEARLRSPGGIGATYALRAAEQLRITVP